ncbi:glycosyl hydrolase catalytic core-domain-containing protein [Apiospora arundinis]|uniref:Glycosyl hydrolase catalytic core-domain-containing protein n=1 Tax=Apiospora arundinis TaxID=335852 RepID=A0ABR2IFT5_9PEZI
MFSKYIVPALAAANLLGVAEAANHHRHLHKRDYIATEVEIVTDIVTVYVTEGDLPTPTPSAASSAKSVLAEAHPYKGEGAPAAAAPSPATTTPVVPVVAPSPPVVEQAPAPQPTTMITATKAAPSPEPVVSIPTQAAVQAPAPIVSKVSSAVSSAYPTAPAPSTGKGGKRGLAYNDPKLVSNICSNSNKFTWAYNWGSQSDGLDAPVTFYPTLWGPQPVHSQGWAENAKKAIANGADTLLSFNECDNGGQCNMDPASAAAAHKSFMKPFVGQAKILAPSITSSQDKGAGIDWLNSFKQACGSDCPMDGCNAHWYGPGGEEGAEEFLGHLRNVNTACGKNNVWVTEFAATSGDTDKFVQHAIKQLDTNATYNFVEKYSYFYLATGSLMQSTNALSTFGNIYATQ